MFCPKCGKMIVKNEKFCAVCGQPIQINSFLKKADPASRMKRNFLIILSTCIALVLVASTILLLRKDKEPEANEDNLYAAAKDVYIEGDVQDEEVRTPTELYEEAKAFYDNEDYYAAIPLFQEAADLGVPDAQAYLGICYQYGLGNFSEQQEENKIKAIEWLSKAEKQGSIPGRYQLAFCYRTGYGVEQDNDEAIRLLNINAGLGDADSMAFLGSIFRSEDYEQNDLETAIEWTRKAAVAGSAKGQYELGVHYLNGIGVVQDYSEAVKWFQLAADQEYAAAQNNLGTCFDHGYGVEQNHEQAAYWYKLSAQNGFADAQINLALCYDEGSGVSQNYESAVGWLKAAADQGNALGQYYLGYHYENGLGVDVDYSMAADLYTNSAEQGYAEAAFCLGNLYSAGHGVPRDSKEAAAWYTFAAQQGHGKAQFVLGMSYIMGLGVIPSYETAEYWLKLAANQDVEGAEAALEVLPYVYYEYND